MEIWLSIIGEYGFPIAVTFYLLYRIEKKLDQINGTMNDLGKLMLYGKPIPSSTYPTSMENKTSIPPH
ncbi:YvrJ family protein [Evansella tamaricis]|uniref:YvrJ family protein n=1 Tax=Evansella tamaricis TaxID=2069301 RepID=A0ABS6JCP4_9BACI|nr:YvrJ family protein [Evansella tamaricis]MBU9711433.1 YvrJ family protein [Evansella tamaricis]